MNSIWFLNNESGLKNILRNRQPIIVLASKSQNRLKLLEKVGINPLVEPSTFPENLSKNLEPWQFVEETAKYKAEEVALRLQETDATFDVVIGADTIIYLNGIIFGKPKNHDDALCMLKELNNQTHSVYTGIALINSNLEIEKFHVKTEVKFGKITDSMLQSYVKSGEAINCAGSYKIQGKASAFVENINGCYYNIVGLPVYELVQRLTKLLKK